MPFDLIVGLLVKAIQAAPKVIAAIAASKDLTEEDKKLLIARINAAKDSVPEWK